MWFYEEELITFETQIGSLMLTRSESCLFVCLFVCMCVRACVRVYLYLFIHSLTSQS